MTSTRRDMFALLPIAAAATALPAAPVVSADLGTDAALIARCEEWVRLDRAMRDLGRQQEELEEVTGECPPEMQSEMRRMHADQEDLDEIGEVPAVTLAGLRAKAKAQLELLGRFDDGRFEDDERMIGGILLDLLRLT